MEDFGLVEAVATVVVLGLIGWQFVFFQFVRPRLMAWVGRRLRVEVAESTDGWDAGTYDTKEPGTLRHTALVFVADVVITIVGTVGVCAVVAIPAFLLGESGLPNRWEGQLTGTSALITSVDVPAMTDREVAARVHVLNDSPVPMRECRVEVVDYRARDGYLHGSSDVFAIEPHTAVDVALRLQIQRRVPGSHAFRVGLECARRLKDRVGAQLEVTN